MPAFRLHTYRPHGLRFDPERVFESSHTSSPVFLSFLQQNYLNYYGNSEEETDECIEAAEWQSKADILLSSGSASENSLDTSTGRHIMHDYAASVAMRGMLFSHTTPVPVSSSSQKSHGLRPVTKPVEWNVNRQAKETSVEMREIAAAWMTSHGVSRFQMHHAYNREDLVRDVIPFVWFLHRDKLGMWYILRAWPTTDSYL